jgi:PAS domain S-box-containing protein
LKNFESVGQRTKGPQRPEDISSRFYNRRIMISFVAIVLLIIAGGVVSYLLQQRQQQNGIANDLNAIAQLKTEQLTAWRQERMADADFMIESVFYAEGVEEWLTNPTPDLESKIRVRLEVLKKNHPYQDVMLVGNDGKILLALNQTQQIDPDTLSQLPLAFKNHQPIMVDFHSSPEEEQPQIDIIAPMFTIQNGNNQPLAAIIMTVAPRDYLYSLIEIWPLPNRTAETLLVRKDGQDALFLSDVKYNPDSSLKLRIPLSRTEVPAVQAVLGREGVFRGTDYRGVKVLSVLRPVPDTPWFIVVKIDISEAYSPVRFNTALILGLTGVLTFIMLLLALFYITNRRRLTYQLLYQTEREREAILKHFEYLVRYANDMIFLIGDNMQIIETNDRVLEVYGYTHEELSQMIIDDLIAPDYLLAHRQKIKDMKSGGHDLFESVHQVKNGTTFPVEVSSVHITVEGQTYLQWIIRDITERKMAEQMLISAKNELEVKVAERTSELAQANIQLQSFAARMVRIQEDEKKRIARDLHDQIGQSLTVLKLMINQASRLPSEQTTQILNEAQTVLSELMGQVREMSLNLRPSMLDDLGLLPTLAWHIARYENQTKIKVIFNHRGLQHNFPPVIAETAYRVVQEALTNAAKYAGVTEIRIDAWMDEFTLTLRVEDKGMGFDPAKLASNVSFGLRGMSERLSAVGGNLKVESEPGTGTILTAVIPLDGGNGN